MSDHVYQRTRGRVAGLTDEERNSEWLGVERSAEYFGGRRPAPASAASAIASLERAHAFWQELLYALPADSWWQEMGAIAGPFASRDKASLVLHQLDEQIHHGAELGVLRDLYVPEKTAFRPLFMTSA